MNDQTDERPAAEPVKPEVLEVEEFDADAYGNAPLEYECVEDQP
jgi:hypothetical protein